MIVPRKLSQWILITLQRDVTIDSGEVIPAGTEVMLVPQTTAHGVLVEGGKSLAELWPLIPKDGQSHEVMLASLAAYSAELVRYADRLTTAEASHVRLMTWAQQNGYIGE